MILFVSQSTGQKRQLFKGANLGSGAFGSVFKLIDDQGNETGLVCKLVKLKGDLLNLEVSKHFTLKATIKEIRILKKLGMLEGYYRRSDKFYIIMPEIKGVIEHKSNNPNKQWFSYQALRNLHRQNIAHLDAHQSNLIIGNDQATAIDFNLASECTYLDCTIDNLSFFLVRSNSFSESFKRLVGWYISDTLKYVSQHKLETARNTLLIGALTLAAIYGIPALYITNVMMWELFWTMAKVQLAKEIKSFGLAKVAVLSLLTGLYGLGVPENKLNKILPILIQVSQGLQSCFSLYFLYSDIAYRAMNNPTLFKNTLNNFQDTAWRDLFSQSSVEVLHQSSLFFLSLQQLISESCHFIEEQLLPKTVLKAEADLLFKYKPQLYAKAKSFFFAENSERVSHHNKPSLVV